jgi:hypothetical protein
MQISLPISSVYNERQTVRLGWAPAKPITTGANIQTTRAKLRNHAAEIKAAQHILKRNFGRPNNRRLSLARVQKQTSGKLQLLPRSRRVLKNLSRHTYKHIAHKSPQNAQQPKKAEPPPTRGVNRDSGTASAIRLRADATAGLAGDLILHKIIITEFIRHPHAQWLRKQE